ncbi:MAG: vWA domain-containing protein [Cypionkella sp.]
MKLHRSHRTYGNAELSLLRRLRRFQHDQAGSLTVFGLMFLILMLMMGGIAVDVMRYEARRTLLQNTLDRSTLAAAALTQDLDPKAVVNDYFLKAGLLQNLTSVTVTSAVNGRQVSATAASDVMPMFMHLAGVSNLDALGVSTAEQRINNVEIMLVLDVSGSMGSNNKLSNLKTAANQFVTSMLANDIEHKISIGIVPFNGQVNLGTSLASQFNLTDLNGLGQPNSPAIQAGVDCVDLPASAYSSYAISPTAPLSMTSNVDTYSGTSTSTPYELNKWCPTINTASNPDVYYVGSPAGSAGNIVRLPHQDVTALKGYINGLTSVGATSINAGLKWGVTLLDPSMQTIYTNAVNANTLPSTMAGRPLSYDAPDAMKVIVLMTDGENFAEERVNSAYKSGLSPIWQGTSDSRWSIFHSSKVNSSNSTNLCNSRPYYVPHLSAWQSRPWNGSSPSSSACYSPTATITGSTNRFWPEIWASMGMQYVAKTFYVNPGISNQTNQMNLFRAQTSTSDMDTQLQTACTAAKNNNVIIYGIAFEASSNGQTQIRGCSTDSKAGSHYFLAQGIQISSAFSAIAKNISQLRLTQ